MDYRFDLFAIFILLGILQAFFLCTFFFSAENRQVKANVFHGLLLVTMALSTLEIFLMYTGYIQNCLFLVDFSEPVAFLIGPFFYFMVVSHIHGTVPKRYYWHLAFAIVYLFLVLPFYLQPEVVKYNSWIDSFHPELPFKPYHYERDARMFWITDHHTSLTMLSLAFYAVLSSLSIIRIFKERQESFWKPVNPILKKIRAGILQISSVTAIIIVIKVFNTEDTGDHWLAAYISLIIYMTSFRVMAQSGFFKQASLMDSKYKTSVKSGENHTLILEKLQTLMATDKPYLQPDFSLPDLAQRLRITVHALSQAINEGLGKNFFEMTAEYRVAESLKLLTEKRNIKVEEISEQVGYNSKSSFNSAFKKITGMTPSQYRTKH